MEETYAMFMVNAMQEMTNAARYMYAGNVTEALKVVDNIKEHFETVKQSLSSEEYAQALDDINQIEDMIKDIDDLRELQIA